MTVCEQLIVQRVKGWSAGYGGGLGAHAPRIMVLTARGRAQGSGTGCARPGSMADARGCGARVR